MSSRHRSDTPSPAPRRTRAQWHAVLLDQQSSGLDLDDFADLRGLNPRSLRWWSWRLRADLGPRPVELVAREELVAPSATVEIVIGDIVVRLLDATPASVAAVVRELRAAC